MPKYPDNYYSTRQEIEDLRADAKNKPENNKKLVSGWLHAC